MESPGNLGYHLRRRLLAGVRERILVTVLTLCINPSYAHELGLFKMMREELWMVKAGFSKLNG